MHIRKILLGTVAAAAMSVSAHAAPINGTGAVALLGIGASAPTIGVGTTFTPSLAVFGGGTGDLLPIPVGTPVTASAITTTSGSVFTFTSMFGDFSGTVGFVQATGPVTGRVVDIYVLGTFTPDVPGPLDTFTAGPMSATFSFTQTGGPGSSVSGSFSLASPPVPPPPGVPAPAALALFGLALAGLGVASRARKA